MSERRINAGPASAQAYAAEKARQGDIILKTKLARAIFFTGLFGGIVLVTGLAVLLLAAP